MALAICLITVLWSRCVVCDSRKSGWRLFVSMKPLQPTWMVCRLACLPPFCATSNRWRYLLSFLSRELRKLFSQQIVSSKCVGVQVRVSQRQASDRWVDRLVGGKVARPGPQRLWFPSADSPACGCRGFKELGRVWCCTCHVGAQPDSGSARVPVSAFSAVPA